MSFGVIGAGVVGITTGLELQKQFPGAKVTLIADKFDKDTTSNGAAGIFRPGTNFTGPSDVITRKWIKDAYDHWDEIKCTSNATLAGVVSISGYIFSSEHKHIVQNSLIDKIVPIYKPATKDELTLCPGNWKYGSFFTTLLIECQLYLPWAYKQFLNNGGKIIERKVNSFQELVVENFDVVVNCSGLGARYLCNDTQIVPLRGQVLKVHAPWVKTFFYGDYDTYIIPGFNGVTLGGCRQFDSYNLNVCPYDSAAIRARCESLLPNLKSAKTVREWVGLRPHRAVVRVEKEKLAYNGKEIKIVHNYGHGGYGVTTAPGTSIHAVNLVKETLLGNSKI